MSSFQLKSVSRSQTTAVSDKQLAKRIASLFESNLADIDLSGIRFFVRDGVIEIRGLVACSSDQRLVLSIVEEIQGVRHVVNRSRTVRAHIYYLSPRRAS